MLAYSTRRMGRVRASRSDSSTPKALERTLEEEEEEEEGVDLISSIRGTLIITEEEEEEIIKTWRF